MKQKKNDKNDLDNLSDFIIDPEALDKEYVFFVKDSKDKQMKLKIVRPNVSQMTQADVEFRAAFSKALRKGTILRAEAEKILKEHDLWTDKEQVQRQAVFTKIEQLKKQLSKIRQKGSDRGKELIDQISKLRNEASDMYAGVSAVMRQTSEQAGDDARLMFYAINLVKDAQTNYPIFTSVDDMDKKSMEPYVSEIMLELMMYFAGVPRDFEKNYYQKRWESEFGVQNSEQQAQKDVEKPKNEDKTKVKTK